MGKREMKVKFHYPASEYTDPDTGEISRIEASTSVATILVDRGRVSMALWKLANRPRSLVFRRACLNYFFPVHVHKHPPARPYSGYVTRGEFALAHRIRQEDGMGLFANTNLPETAWMESTQEFDTCLCSKGHPCLLHKGSKVLDCSVSESRRAGRWPFLQWRAMERWANGWIGPKSGIDEQTDGLGGIGL